MVGIDGDCHIALVWDRWRLSHCFGRDSSYCHIALVGMNGDCHIALVGIDGDCHIALVGIDGDCLIALVWDRWRLSHCFGRDSSYCHIALVGMNGDCHIALVGIDGDCHIALLGIEGFLLCVLTGCAIDRITDRLLIGTLRDM